MKTNKSYAKRVRVTPSGKLLIRKRGVNHYNAKEPRRVQLARKRGIALNISQRARRRFLPGT